MAHALSLQAQVKAYEDKLTQLRYANPEELVALLQEPVRVEPQSNGQPERLAAAATDGQHLADATTLQQDIEGPQETSVGVDGGVCFYGKTSLYHVEPQGADKDALASGHLEETDEHGASTNGASYASPPLLTKVDNATCSILTEISKELLDELLAAYWCLPHHFHLVLCKRLFLRMIQSRLALLKLTATDRCRRPTHRRTLCQFLSAGSSPGPGSEILSSAGCRTTGRPLCETVFGTAAASRGPG